MQVLMVQGTTSDAGKSTLVAGLCRVLANRGIKVAPFKPQNMALNSAVTVDGGEIGRAQALQAVAARVEATTDFNPVLLKPNTDTGAQVIIHGKAVANMEASVYHDYKTLAMNAVLDSHQRLAELYDVLLVEGAGSPAEINLRDRDIANMGYAEAVDCPVIIIADIDKGGVFAHLVGTLALLSESEQARVKGFVINRFRGDIGLLQPGLDWLEEYTGKPVLGVLPYLHDLYLDAEDAVDIKNPVEEAQMKVVVLGLPHISNHTDFDPLRLHPNIDMRYVRTGEAVPAADLLILPGSKNVLGDLAHLRAQGWDKAIFKHLRFGGKVIGICGGYQMLGESLSDPLGIESEQLSAKGLGLLPVSTELKADKALIRAHGQLQLNGLSADVAGYEIHCGVTEFNSDVIAHAAPLSLNNEQGQPRQDGCIDSSNQVLGCYLHGLFDHPDACNELLQWVDSNFAKHSAIDINALREQQLERYAGVCEEHLDIDRIFQILEGAE